MRFCVILGICDVLNNTMWSFKKGWVMKALHFLGICLFLTAACSADMLGETQYFAVFMDGRKVGHSMQSRVVSAGKVTTTETVDMTINRLGTPLNFKAAETTIETIDGKPLGFELEQDLGTMAVKVVGSLDANGLVHVTSTSMEARQQSAFQWPQGAMMSEGLRLLTLKKGLKEGTRYTAKLFSPGLMQAAEAEVQVGKKQRVDLLGRVVELTEVVTVLNVPAAGEIVSTGYIDDQLRLQKNITPVAGIQVEMVACTREFALSNNEVYEFVEKTFLNSPQPLNDIGSAESAVYYLSPKQPTTSLQIPSTGNQSVRIKKDGRVVVTVRPVAVPKGGRFPYTGSDKNALEALEPTRFIQSDNEKIKQLAGQAIGNTKDAVEATKEIESFVANYIENKNLSVGYASAVEVAQSRQGDCTEFAVLTAALCRAIGIPARVVTGVAYISDFAGMKNKFGGHAWTEAYLSGKWVGLDASFKSAGGGYDAGHIALAVGAGDPEDFFSLVNIIGRFEIDEVTVEKGR